MSHIYIDGQKIPFAKGQTIMDAAMAAGVYIPHLCHHPEFTPHGSCKLCEVKVNGRNCSSCTFPAEEGQDIQSNTDELNAMRKRIVQMLFVEGNHLCPSCEKTGNCQLQAVAYHLKMLDSHFPHFYEERSVDSSHPDILLDRNRCIFCALCVRASHDENKDVFGIVGRGINKHLDVNSISGELVDSEVAVTDRACEICPTGAILMKGSAYKTPIGQRLFDKQEIDTVCLGVENE